MLFAAAHESAVGPKQTRARALHMSACDQRGRRVDNLECPLMTAHLLHSHLADSAQGEGPATFTHNPDLAFCAPIHHALQSKVSG